MRPAGRQRILVLAVLRIPSGTPGPTPLPFGLERATLDSRFSRWWTVAAVAALTLWLFGATLLGTRTFVFRDAAHYFAPLFQFNVAEWRAGRVPLWNPYEGIGMPQLAENTASVFYPAQLLLLLPVDFYWAYNVYIVAHVLLAAWGAYRLARHLGTSELAAGQAALAYAFSGSVLFQYCNVIFLVGAAWLPPALLATDQLLRGGGLKAAAWLGCCWAMMVLGGDPQMAYHAALLAAAYAVYLSIARTKSLTAENRARRGLRFFKPLLTRGAALLGAGAIAFALAAVQILPTSELAAISPRASYDVPRSVWELAAWKLRGKRQPANASQENAFAALYDARQSGDHLQRAYEFSVGPWRWPELAFANISGRQFPRHYRWMSALPWEGRIWSPTLYCGAITIVLAWGGWRLRHGDPRLRCCWWLSLWAIAASLGEYGMGWLWLEFGRSAPAGVGPEVGGVYWLMNLLLPGYVAFRYPAKLWTIAALGISMLAARGWDACWSTATTTSILRFRWLAIGGLFCGILVFAFRGRIGGWFSAAAADPLFGPLQPTAAMYDLLLGLLQTAAVCEFSADLLLAAGGKWSTRAAIGMLLLSAADLGLAHRWLVPTVDTAEFRREPAWVSALRATESAPNVVPRVYRSEHWLPPVWSETSSGDRLTKMVHWDRESLWPKYHLPFAIGSVQTSGMLAPADYMAIWQDLQSRDYERGEHWRPALLRLVGVRTAIDWRSARSRRDLPHPEAENVGLYNIRSAQPHAWTVHTVTVLSPLPGNSPRQLRARTEEALCRAGKSRDWAQEAVVECSASLPSANPSPSSSSSLQPAASSLPEFCRVTVSEPQRVVVDAELANPGLVVLSDMYYPGWEVTIHDAAGSRPGEILRTNRVMRGVWLEAGQHQLEFRYRPATFRWGAAISATAWLLGAVALAVAATAASRRRWARTAAPAALPPAAA